MTDRTLDVVGAENPAEPEPRRRDGWRNALQVVGVLAALGVLGGVLWWLLYDPAMFTKAASGDATMNEIELAKRFNADGWYAVIAAVLGLVAGCVLTWRGVRAPVVTVVSLITGSVLAALLMRLVGGLLGPPAVASVLADVKVGEGIPMPLEVTGRVVYLVWPIASLIGSLIVLWSPPADQAD